MSYCADCVAKAKLRNRDMVAMLQKAKKQALENKKPFAVCWAQTEGLYITDAHSAINSTATIRHIVSGLQ